MNQYIFNPLFEKDDEFANFGETPNTEPIEKEELEEAQEQVKEKEEESGTNLSDDELESLPESEVMKLRFTPHFDYGTPGGSNCNSCGCEDAGDVAIIDSEVQEGDSKDLGNGIIDNSTPEETDITGDIAMYYKNHEAYLQYRDVIPSMEGISDLVSNLFAAIRFVVIKTIKYTRRVYKFSRKKLGPIVFKTSTIHKLWKFKISRNLSKIDQDALSSMEIDAFPLDNWLAASKTALASFDMVKSAERIVFDSSDVAVTNSMKGFAERLEQTGVKFIVNKNQVNMDELMDNRRFDNVISLGYNKSQIVNCLRYAEEISKRVPNEKENNLEQITDRVIKRISNYAAMLNEAVEKGELTKNSDKYKEKMDDLMNYTVRLDFILSCMRCAHHLFDLLLSDLEKVFSKYEDSLVNEQIR